MNIGALHVITDDDVLARAGFLTAAAAVLEAGGPAVTLHLRGHGTSGGRLLEMGTRLTGSAKGTGSRLLVNDRVDVALAVDAAGVQVGKRGLPVGRVRELIGRRLLGYSAHGVEEAAAAVGAGADFVLVGTIYETSSHPGEAVGPDLIRACAGATDAPAIAIGGITPARVREVWQAGGRGVAVRGGVWDAPDPGAAVIEFVQALGDAGSSGTGNAANEDRSDRQR